MALERLTQITEVGIQSGITLRNVNVEGAYVSGVVTATSLNITSGGANFTGVVTATSFVGNVTGNINPTSLNVSGVSTFGSNVFLGDGDIAYFGDGQDLLIFHNSTDSIIRDNGTGDLFIQGGNRVRITNPTGIETYAVFNQDGSSELWYDNVKRLETSGIGVSITSALTVGTGASISSPATNVLALGTNNTESVRIGSTGSVGIGTNESYGDSNASFTSLSLGGNGTRYGLIELNKSDGIAGSWIDCYGTGGNGDLRITTAGTSGAITFWTGGAFTEKVRINSSGNIGIGSTNPGYQLTVDQGTGDGNLFTLKNEEVSLITGVWGTGSTYPREVTLNATRNDSGALPALRLAGQGGLKFAVDLNTVRMEIDSSGRVLMPYQPAFTAYLSSNHSYTGGGARRVIPFDAVVTNIGSHFNTSTNRFIAPVAGTYLFTASLVCNSGSSTTYFSCDIFVNGAAVPGSSGWQNMGAGYQIQRSSLIVYLNVNDYVDVRMEKSANDTINGASNYSGFTGTLLG